MSFGMNELEKLMSDFNISKQNIKKCEQVLTEAGLDANNAIEEIKSLSSEEYQELASELKTLNRKKFINACEAIHRNEYPASGSASHSGSASTTASLPAYHFKLQNIVVITHGIDNKTLRVNPSSTDNIDPNGRHGQFAQWLAEPSDNGSKCKFKSVHTGKYLRILGNGKIDVGGNGGMFTVFKIRQWGTHGQVKMESNHHNGKYIAVDKNGVRCGNGGPFCKLTVSRIKANNNNNNNNNNANVTVIETPIVNVVTVTYKKCPKCNGKGYWGTFGACDLNSIHKKGNCPACKSQGRIASNREKCFRCEGKGFWGTFGACEEHSIHKTQSCPICKGNCYIVPT